MKKLLAILLALVVTVSLVACVGPQNDPTLDPDGSPSGTNPDNTPSGTNPDNTPGGTSPEDNPSGPDSTHDYDSPYDDEGIETALTTADLDGLHVPQYLCPITQSTFHYLDFTVEGDLITCTQWTNNTIVGNLSLIDNPCFDYGETTLLGISSPDAFDDYTEYLDNVAIREVIRTAEKCYVITPIDDPACTSDVPVYLFRMGDELFAFRTTDGPITVLFRVTLD